MRINFVLPENGNHPVGGFKIVFQYANELVRMGHEVSISFMNNLYPERVGKLRAILKKNYNKVTGNNESRMLTWFELNPQIKLYYNVISNSDFPHADVVIATAVQTAGVVAKLDKKFGRKYYLIQNYETWAYDDVSQVNDTFKLPLTKIVIAKWLFDIVSKYTDEKVYIVPNFLNHKKFFLSERIDNRDNEVSMLYHKLPEKNTQFGLKVLDVVKQSIPDLRVQMFGIFDQPKNLPNFITYHQQPTQDDLRNEIYGASKVYLLPSLLEGWCLTGMEAMASGAVLVSSDIGGVRDYTNNGKNSILIEPNNLVAFSDAIIRVLKSNVLQKRLASQAVHDINQFHVAKSTNMLLNILNGDN